MKQSVKVGEVVEVTTERLAYGGDAVARHEGLTLFIPYAAPGERLRVRIVESRKNFARAIIESILEPSPVRQTPRCSYYGDCGGCQLQHVTYAAELEAKAGFIRDAFGRVGKIDWPHEIPVIHGAEFGYRSRAQIKIGRPMSPNGPLTVGFHRAASNTICDVQSCPVLIPELDAALRSLRNIAQNASVAESTGLAGLREVEVAGGDLGVAFAPAPDGLPFGLLERRVGGLRYGFGADTFFQGNSLLLDAMVAEAIQDYSGGLAVDLYAGVGLFALQIAGRFTRVIAVESNRQAVQHGLRNVASNQLTNVLFENARVERWLSEFAHTDDSAPDLLLLDPPRTGAADAISGITEIGPSRIVYVSCDPPTLARDVRRLLDGGFVLERVAGIDLFPRTFHIETIAHLRRG